MDDKRCCENCDDCRCSHGGDMLEMECCAAHKVSKEHLKAKKQILEKKLKMIELELGEK